MLSSRILIIINFAWFVVCSAYMCNWNKRQLKKYLDILATDGDSVTGLNQYYQSHHEELQKLLTILNPKAPSLLDETDNVEDDERSMLTRQSSIKSYAGSVSIYQDEYVSQKSLRHIADDQTDLNRLLNRYDESQESSNPLKKIKKFKTNFFLKRLSSMRSKRSEKQDDQISIKSNSSDTSKISLVDIKNEIKKLKRLKKPKFRKAFVNVDDQGIGMASILARSVIHAHTSLACIAETQDSEHSPNSTLRRTSESEPTIAISDDDVAKIIKVSISKDTSASDSIEKNIPEIHFASLKNVSSEGMVYPGQRAMSESCPSSPLACRTANLLKLPGETGYFGSLSSALSGESSEIYSSSDEDDESSDQRTDTEKFIETTSSLVSSVINQKVDPVLIAHMEKKLSILDNTPSSSYSEDKILPEDRSATKTFSDNVTPLITVATNVGNDKKQISEDKVQEKEIPHTSEKDTDTFVPSKSSAHHFKFHNPFSHKRTQSISAPSSPVESKGFVYRSSKKIKRQFSKISNSSMIKSLSHYSLIPKKKQVEIKSPMSQPSSSTDVTSKAPSDTVLGSPFLSYADLLSLDKEGHGFEHDKLHKSDEFNRSKFSMYIGSEPESRASFSGTYFTDDPHNDHNLHSHKKETCNLKPTGLVHTAMETILIDKVQSLLIPTSPDSVHDRKFFDDVTEKLERVEESRSGKPETTGMIHSAMETILMDKAQSMIPSTSPPYSPTKTSFGSENTFSHKSIDSDQSGTSKRNSKKKRDSDQESTGLVHTAMETILIDKVQSLFSAPVPLVMSQNEENITNEKDIPTGDNTKREESKGLINEAVQTILRDRANSLKGDSGELKNTEHSSNEATRLKEKENISSDTGTDTESLMTKVQSFFTTKDKNSDETLKHEKKNSSGLIYSAVETMLVDKVQSLLPNTDREDKDDTSSPESEIKKHVTKDKKLVRQDSIHPVSDNEESRKMSNEHKRKSRAPVLQSFHPILSGAVLETIPSLPESSFDRTESIDEQACCKCEVCGSIDTNSASVCGNSHAVCDVCRCERDRDRGEKERGSPRHARHESYGSREPVTSQAQNSSLNASSTPMGIHRRSSDSDLSVTPKGSSLNTSAANTGSGGGAILRPSMNSNNLEMLEYPFLTMTEYPPGFIVHIGGTVCARSVKLVDGGGESAARAAWWAELRTELRAHARALRCNAVIAYTDTAAICEDVCVLSASGTAAVINLDCDFNAEIDAALAVANGSKNTIDEIEADSCSVAHVPYSPGTGPYRAELSTCGGCRRARVPAVLLATCSKPNRLLSYPKAVTLTAVAARTRRAPPASEPGARDISDQLPFLEYELHKLLLAKLRMQGANALFNLQTQITIGERCVMALASGTAVRLTALPPPAPPRIKATENEKEALEIQKALWDSFTANKIANGYDVGGPEHSTNGALPEIEGEEPPALDLCADKDACVLELDEAEDVETARTLATRRLHTRLQVFTNALKPLKGAPPYAFTQVWRGKISSGAGGVRGAGERQVGRALDALAYKLRRLQPAALLAATFRLELPEDEIQLVVSGAATRLEDPNKPEPSENGHQSQPQQPNQGHSQGQGHSNGTGDTDDEIFTLDEEQLIKSTHSEPVEDKAVVNGQVPSPSTVSLTSLYQVSGARAARRVCALRLLFVRETTTVRELGGLSGFLHTFTSEVLAIVRAYTAALGGNALTSFYITQLMLQDNAHKNQGQCLLSVGGDVVHITY